MNSPSIGWSLPIGRRIRHLALLAFALALPGAVWAGPRSIPGAASTGMRVAAVADQATRPDPAGWYAGDMHVHRSCGGSPVPITSIRDDMIAADLDVVSLLADMGNGEVQDPVTDLPKVNGQDDPISTAGRIVHWDAEWHWDAIYGQYPHQALGGHLVALGLSEAHEIWREYTYPILDWAHQQGGIAGFAHFQYLDEDVPEDLTCCTPVEYPVEVALGAADFISEDVHGADSAIHAYYRLLNCGFRPGFAAGSDYPCGSVIGPSLTYAQVTDAPFTYRGWIGAIAHGRTVVSRKGRTEFLDLHVNGAAGPGDEIPLATAGSVHVSAVWTSTSPMARTIELVRDGVVVARRDAAAAPGAPDSLIADVAFAASGWLAGRVMGPDGHELQTAAVFVTVAGAPVRVSAEDAEFYVRWMDRLLENISPGGIWNGFFPTDLATVQSRYAAARARYQQIADEAAAGQPSTIFLAADTPAEENVNDESPLELGLRFRSMTDGYVTGVRFFKGASNTGDHSGHLWSQAGTLLAETSFTAESDVGWQEAAFPVPVPIHADTTYVVSYHSPGWYSDTPDYFGTAIVHGPLRALADGEDGANGVYLYTPAPAFPTMTYQSTNYWVDVTFVPGDITPPAVDSLSPAPNATQVPCEGEIRARFSEALDTTTVNTATFLLLDPQSATVAATVHYDDLTRTASLAPGAPLADSTTYTARLRGGNSGPRIRDVAGNPLVADVQWSFTTERPAVLSAGDMAPAVSRLTVRPNPSRGAATLVIEAPAGGFQSLEVLDVSGRVVREFSGGRPSAGRWTLDWDGRDGAGRPIPAGLYFARMRTRTGSSMARFVVVR